MQTEAWARGKLSTYFEVHKDEQLFESLRLYALCKEFNVLPASGGIYDQDPMLIREWQIISNVVARVVDEQNRQTQSSVSYGGKTSVNGLQFKRVPQVPSVFKRYIKK